ncbi:integrin alpha-4-like [Zerene cesonia]|uniref:integrin alpha-4-like n=1 Tax=Zerene cesonia TaxID=33412 RepID=UPI0018E50056|nr:integrin alpha-4-like [Zerene cesonia]
MLKLSIFLLTIITSVHSLYHIPSMKKFSPQKEMAEEALFGYSIAYQASTKRLFISAPKADHVGKVFTMDENGNMTKISFYLDNINITAEHSIWLGATVRASNDFFVTCAPRYGEMKYPSTKKKERALAVLGLCFIQAVNADMHTLKGLQKQERATFGTKFEYRMDSFGWDIGIDNEMEVILGSPIHRGQVSIYEDPLSTDNPKLISKIVPKDAVDHNYGYSITFGKFFTNESLFAISSTYGDVGIGKVFFFNKKYTHIQTIRSDRVGIMFGAALCSLRLNVHYDSLLIGAPTYAEDANTNDAGAVYVFVPDSDVSANRLVYKKTIKATEVGGYFGNAMLNLGDMDGDGKDEVAIAAPYEDDGAGAVYIYSGYSLLNEPTTYRVRVKPEGFRSFGFSLTSIENQENGCNDLSIGAPYSNSVFLVQCMASVTVQLRATLPSFQFKHVDKLENFDMEVCLDVTYPEKPREIDAAIEIRIELSTIYSKLKEGSDTGIFSYVVAINDKKPPYCRKLGVQVKIPNTEFFQVIEYNITAGLLSNPEDSVNFEPSRVLLSERSRLSLQGKESVSTCGAGKTVCIPNIVHTISSSMKLLNSSAFEYWLGSTDREHFAISLENKGDPAYSLCTVIQIEGVNVLTHPRSCSREHNSFLCKPRFTLQKGDIWNMGNFLLETGILNSKDKQIKIINEVYNHCGNVSEKQYYEKTVILYPDSSLQLNGVTNPNDMINTTAENLNTVEKKFEHVYTITNRGKTNWVGMLSEIVFNNSFHIDFLYTTIYAYPEWGAIVCPVSDGSNLNYENKFICNIGDMRPNQKITIYISIVTKIGSFEESDDAKNISISTAIHLLDVKSSRLSIGLETILLCQIPSVALWIIIVAVIFSLILLAIIAFVLYKCGFLRRKKKGELKTLKKEYHRRSMLRQSMRASRINTGDNNILLEHENDQTNKQPS